MQQLQGAVAPGVGGSVVALDPETGAVKVMASIPGFDPNVIDQPDTFSKLSTDPAAPLVNRPTQSVYTPGSTMKVVTASAALDTGEFDPDTVLNADSPNKISGSRSRTPAVRASATST